MDHSYLNRDLEMGRMETACGASTQNDHDLAANEISQSIFKPTPTVHVDMEEDSPDYIPRRTREGLVLLEKKACAKERFYFKCFRHLYLYNIMYYQDELVKLEASFDPKKPWTIEQMKQLGELLGQYRELDSAHLHGQNLTQTQMTHLKSANQCSKQISSQQSTPAKF